MMLKRVLVDSGINIVTNPDSIPVICHEAARVSRKIALELKLLDSLQFDSLKTDLFTKLRSAKDLKQARSTLTMCMCRIILYISQHCIFKYIRVFHSISIVFYVAFVSFVPVWVVHTVL